MKILKSSDGNLVELTVEMKAKTSKAILVGYAEKEVWLPLSQLEDGPNDIGNGLFEIIIPEWLAIKTELA
jgi:hypothetical protein